jgi:hypothetical protein
MGDWHRIHSHKESLIHNAGFVVVESVTCRANKAAMQKAWPRLALMSLPPYHTSPPSSSSQVGVHLRFGECSLCHRVSMSSVAVSNAREWVNCCDDI